MHVMHIRSVDLNLVPIFLALMETRSVSVAARRLALSQSATSHALTRLRELFRDPLLIRAGRTLVPTHRALKAEAQLSAGAALLEQGLLGTEDFDPKTASRQFRLASADYAEIVLLPSLVKRLRDNAPLVDLWFESMDVGTFERLTRGYVDVIVSTAPGLSGERKGLTYAPLIEDEFVSIVRNGHPLLRGKMSVARFAQANHVFIAPGGKPGGVVDAALAARGMTRRIALAVPHFVVAPYIVAQTDLVLTVGRRLAQALARTAEIRIFETPLTLPSFELGMYWHPRSESDPAHQYLRGALTAVSQGRRARFSAR
jgi:DNA-binding transcriptional LysR family regulator